LTGTGNIRVRRVIPLPAQPGPPASSTTAAPNVLAYASFETDFDGFDDGGGSPPALVARDTTHAYRGSFAVRRDWTASGVELGGGLHRQFSPVDRMYSQFALYASDYPGAEQKLWRWFGPGFDGAMGGIWTNGDAIAIWFDFNQSPFGWAYPNIPWPKNQFNIFDLDFWQVGHPSGRPAVRMKFNGSLVSWTPGVHSVDGDFLVANYRDPGVSGGQLGAMEALATLNGQFRSGSEWIDSISFSTADWITPPP
jgi:hypothetical protein